MCAATLVPLGFAQSLRDLRDVRGKRSVTESVTCAANTQCVRPADKRRTGCANGRYFRRSTDTDRGMSLEL